MQKLNSFPKSHHFAIKSLFSFFSSLSETPNTNPLLFNYLIKTLNIPNSRALQISNKYPRIKSLEKPRNVCQYFHDVGFSDTHIQLTVSTKPDILFSDVDKTLKPKIEFFQHLGFVDSDLGKFISKNPSILDVSLERKLIPRADFVKKMLVDDTDNENFIRVVRRSIWFLTSDPEKSGLLRNIKYLKSCGIVGSQLSMLLVRQPRFFFLKEFKLKDLVSRVLALGFSANSRMFVYGLRGLSSLNEENFERKMDFFLSYGFSKEEFITMIRRAPLLLGTSIEKVKSGLEFFFKEIKLEKAALVRNPVSLLCNLENRVIPRYRVLEIVTSRKMLKRESSLTSVLLMSEEKFMKKFVLRFGDNAEELLRAYKGQRLGSSDKAKS